MSDKELVRLSKVRAGETVKLVDIDAGENLRSRLAAMGMVRDVKITVIQNGHPGPFVVSVKGTRVAIGRGMAEKVLVSTSTF
jgi:Fe2+ transport system protein FeoA